AMVNGKPVIASAAGGIVDIVRDGRNGFLVPPGDAPALADAVRACMADPQRARRMGLQGREDVEAGFSWPVIADRLAEVYRSVARRG
ncbi:MAG TPA: glycosyltransferase family 4 protein, partial [Longimicrobiaceae bacterium]|nr:glycosyltransferase family 4 protein [Longimicrobiaceae bacterium]